MKFGILKCTAMIFFAALPVALNAQGNEDPSTHYAVTNLGTLGGTSSQGNGINNISWVTGAANLPGDQTEHATLWVHGRERDLGTLGGPNSAVLFPVKSDHGQIAGVSETAALDPLGEHWSCSAFFPTLTGHQCLGFVWDFGVMRPLPTLGGNNGFAAGVNNRGQVIGWAENAIHDPTCVPPQVLQFRPVVWGPEEGQIRELPTLPGDPDGSAVAINDLGQIVGISGICDRAVGRFSARRAVMWEDGKIIDLGTLGGVAWNTPVAINNKGQVAGFADLPGDQDGNPRFRAFLWTANTGMQDLGTLPGDSLSEALGINEQGQIVGESCTAGFASCRAFIWQDGVMTDLNTLIPPGAISLIYAGDINDRGEITGGLVDQSSTQCGPATGGCAFLAVPAQNEH